jgi:hypothetical protein
MPIFRKRSGVNPVWQEDDYQKEHTEEAVRKLKELGVTLAILHFYKGFGLQAEKAHMEDARRLATLCKKYGIRVGVYVGSTIAYETFLLENPEAEQWFVPDYMGRPVFYGLQTFRKRVYFMHPGYREYMKRVLRIAVEDLKADLIHFDNTSNQAEAPIFFHPLAIQEFRDFLKRKYTPEQLDKRLGFSDVSDVLPPKIDAPLSVIVDPLFQEWADFRCERLSQYYAEMADYIHSLNPEVAVECNPHSGWSGRNTMWVQGVDYPRLLAHVDIVWSEEGNDAGVDSQGILVSKINSYKMATHLNNQIFTYTGENLIGMAEAMAYNRQCLGYVGGGLAGYELPEAQRRYIRFYEKHFDQYHDVQNLADVAVLQSYPTMTFNNDRPYQNSFLVLQTLIQARIPFDIIFDQQLNDLSKYRVLILPDQESLADASLEKIRKFVSAGGGLIATERTSLYTEWRQRRSDFGLKDLLQVAAPAYVPEEEVTSEGVLNVAEVKRQVGPGRVVYIPEIKPAVAKPAAKPMESRYWKLPLNWQEFVQAVRWAARDPLSLEMKAPLTVTAEVTEPNAKNELMVHLVNYDAKRQPVVNNIEVSLRLPVGKEVSQLSVLSPDEEMAQKVPFGVESQRVNFTVPKLQIYDLVVVRMKP